jgi:hypothetical protein
MPHDLCSNLLETEMLVKRLINKYLGAELSDVHSDSRLIDLYDGKYASYDIQLYHVLSNLQKEYDISFPKIDERRFPYITVQDLLNHVFKLVEGF